MWESQRTLFSLKNFKTSQCPFSAASAQVCSSIGHFSSNKYCNVFMFPLLAASQDVDESHRHCFISLTHFNNSKSFVSHTKEQNSSSSRVHRFHAHSSVSFDENSPTASRVKRRYQRSVRSIIIDQERSNVFFVTTSSSGIEDTNFLRAVD